MINPDGHHDLYHVHEYRTSDLTPLLFIVSLSAIFSFARKPRIFRFRFQTKQSVMASMVLARF